MPVLLLTNPTTLIYDTVTGEVFYMKNQKLWYASSVADSHRDRLLALFKKDETNIEFNIDDLLFGTGLVECPPEKTLTLLEHVANELVAALTKEDQYDLRHTNMMSLVHQKLADKRAIEQHLLTKFNALLNEKKKEIAHLRQELSRQVRPHKEEEEEEEEDEEEIGEKPARKRIQKRVAPKTSSIWDEWMTKRKNAAAAVQAKKNESLPSSDSESEDEDNTSIRSTSSSDLLAGGSSGSDSDRTTDKPAKRNAAAAQAKKDEDHGDSSPSSSNEKPVSRLLSLFPSEDEM